MLSLLSIGTGTGAGTGTGVAAFVENENVAPVVVVELTNLAPDARKERGSERVYRVCGQCGCERESVVESVLHQAASVVAVLVLAIE